VRNDGLRTVIVWFGSDWREDEMVDGLDVEVVVELLDILIRILEFVMSDRVILGVGMWRDQLLVRREKRTYVLVFDTPVL
jgi:hypothetical protein